MYCPILPCTAATALMFTAAVHVGDGEGVGWAPCVQVRRADVQRLTGGDAARLCKYEKAQICG